MKRRVLAVACGLSLVIAAGACKKKEEKPPVPQTGMPGQQQVMPPGGQQMPPGPMMPKGETVIAVPDSVKGKWKGVVLVVEDKQAMSSKEYTIDLNSGMKIPGSNLDVKVGEFLPDFRMEGLTITSLSNSANNPAVGVNVSENGKQVFPVPGKKWGWLYARPELRNIHAFEHPKYSIVLKNGIKKG